MYIDDSRCIGNALEGTNDDEIGNATNMAFSTTDRDNDKSNQNCAGNMKGGWWYNKCTNSNLNGEYRETGQTCMTWTTSDSTECPFPCHKETMISVRRTSSTTDECAIN